MKSEHRGIKGIFQKQIHGYIKQKGVVNGSEVKTGIRQRKERENHVTDILLPRVTLYPRFFIIPFEEHVSQTN